MLRLNKKKWHRLFLLLNVMAASSMTGCNSIPTSQALSPYNQALKLCQSKYKNAVDEIKCVYSSPDYERFTQTQKQAVAYGAVLAERIAKGEMTAAEAKFAQITYENKLKANNDAINSQNAAIAAQQQQASGNALMGMGTALMMAGQPRPAVIYPAPQQNYPRQTTCTGLSNVVNCMNY